MAQITQSYIEARQEGIAWLNSLKRDFISGVAILTKSGYKSIVASKLARTGERPHTREKLEYEMRQMIQVWYNPDDPRFEDVDLSENSDTDADDDCEESVLEEVARYIVTAAVEEESKEGDEQPGYPPCIAKVIYNFRDCYNQRAGLHRLFSELGETNTEVVVQQRKALVTSIAGLSARMTILAKIKKRYDSDKVMPTDEELDELFATPADDKKENADEEDETDISLMSVDELKKAKSNAKSKITKARNMLLYSSESKPKDGNENPLPDCPKRVRYEKKIASQEALVEKIDYRLAELQ